MGIVYSLWDNLSVRRVRMKLCLKNIGKIKSACVDINGITVIAGNNDTGKSTIGKALFAIFNSLYRSDEKIVTDRADSINNLV